MDSRTLEIGCRIGVHVGNSFEHWRAAGRRWHGTMGVPGNRRKIYRQSKSCKSIWMIGCTTTITIAPSGQEMLRARPFAKFNWRKGGLERQNHSTEQLNLTWQLYRSNQATVRWDRDYYTLWNCGVCQATVFVVSITLIHIDVDWNWGLCHAIVFVVSIALIRIGVTRI